jgi:hypothetical protein
MRLENKFVSEQAYEALSEKKSVWRISEASTPTVAISGEFIT